MSVSTKSAATMSNDFNSKLLFLLSNPTQEMIAAGTDAIRTWVEALYIGSTAAQDILKAMVEVAMMQAEHG